MCDKCHTEQIAEMLINQDNVDIMLTFSLFSVFKQIYISLDRIMTALNIYFYRLLLLVIFCASFKGLIFLWA